MKWYGEIEYKDVEFNNKIKEVAIIEYDDGIYNIEEHYRKFDDGSRKIISCGLWAFSLGSAKIRLTQDTIFKTSDWSWKKLV